MPPTQPSRQLRYRQSESADAVTLEPASPATAAIIWLHGLGADGHDFVPIVPELVLPDTLSIRFVFPHAPVRPVTINNGYAMRAWYDIKVLSASIPPPGANVEDAAGIRAAETLVRAFISREAERGVPSRRIFLAGFSQGGAIALQTGLRHPERLGGIIALSSYLPLRDTLAAEAHGANRDVPILMCHGDRDPVLPLILGERSRELLVASGHRVEWHTYPMAHQVSAEEIADISAWVSRVAGER